MCAGSLCLKQKISVVLMFIFFIAFRILRTFLNWQMFTNGMRESVSSMVCLKDVPLEAFKIMLEFMYSGELNKGATEGINTLLLQLLLLADEFGVTLLHQECCKILLECLSEVIL